MHLYLHQSINRASYGSASRTDPRGEASEGCPRRSPQGEGGPVKYVYILHSIEGDHFYVGITDELRGRLAKHNAGEVPHTSKFAPWRLKTYVAFSDEA